MSVIEKQREKTTRATERKKNLQITYFYHGAVVMKKKKKNGHTNVLLHLLSVILQNGISHKCKRKMYTALFVPNNDLSAYGEK